MPGHALGRAKINRRAFLCYTAVGLKSKTPAHELPEILEGMHS